ncbi:hypothetical protein BGZ98_007870 [Dissophora globulifera]|nr:hypothetical protein BGZ98_007870 [Dissophora globulifera]
MEAAPAPVPASVSTPSTFEANSNIEPPALSIANETTATITAAPLVPTMSLSDSSSTHTSTTTTTVDTTDANVAIKSETDQTLSISVALAVTPTIPNSPVSNTLLPPLPIPEKGLTTIVREKSATNDQPAEIRNKEWMIANVLQRGRIFKVSHRLRTRLEYAILKIRRGWSKYTLSEVESLLFQPSSPPQQNARYRLRTRGRPSTMHRRSYSSTSASSSINRQQKSKTKRTRKEHRDEEEQLGNMGYVHSRFRYLTDDQESETEEAEESESLDEHQDRDVWDIGKDQGQDFSGPTQSRFIQRSRPSFSEFKDSELFLPAKSLMDIAGSPSPSLSPRLCSRSSLTAPAYRHGSAFRYGSAEPLYGDSTPTGRGDSSTSNDDGWSSRSLPSSPFTTSSSTMQDTERQRGDTDEDGMEEPQDAQQAAQMILLLASRPKSRARTPATIRTSVASDTAAWTSRSSLPLSPPSPISIGGNTVPYSPMTSSPLVRFRTVAPIDDEEDDNAKDNDRNPFLVKKRNRASKATPLRSTSTLLSSRSQTLTSASSDDSSVAVEDVLSTEENENQQHQHESNIQATITVKDEPISESQAVTSRPPRTPEEPRTTTVGIRTPPPSGSQDAMIRHHHNSHSPSLLSAQSIAARRRSSGITGGSDLLTMFPITLQPPVQKNKK